MTQELWGEAASLTAAALWAVAVTLFRPAIRLHGAQAVNLLKCGLATVALGATAWATGLLSGEALGGAAGLGWLAASGLVGLTVGDTALFAAVGRLGPHRSLLLQTLAPLFTAAAAAAAWGEHLAPLEIVGGLAVLAGVTVVVAPGRRPGAPPAAGSPDAPPPAEAEGLAATSPARAPGVAPLDRVGLLLGLTAAAGQGIGIVLAKPPLETVHVLPATFLRLAAGTLGLMAVGALRGTLVRAAAIAVDGRALKSAVPATLLGTYLAMLLMMAGIAWAPASIAAVLLATPPVFSLFVEAALGRERITVRGVAGTLVAVGGVALLSFR